MKVNQYKAYIQSVAKEVKLYAKNYNTSVRVAVSDLDFPMSYVDLKALSEVLGEDVTDLAASEESLNEYNREQNDY